jgi:hypothetical protein
VKRFRPSGCKIGTAYRRLPASAITLLILHILVHFSNLYLAIGAVLLLLAIVHRALVTVKLMKT